MRIAIVGTRGIPARYGGFETFAEELAIRLAGRGHEVTVYTRRGAVPEVGARYRGVRLSSLPTIRHKYLDTVVHTLLSIVHLVSHRPRPQIVIVCNGANAVFSWIPRFFGVKTVLNVDGIERLRRKWGLLGRLWYRLGETLARKLPTVVVADARVIQDYYRARHGLETCYIPYGGDHYLNGSAPAASSAQGSSGHDVLRRLGLQPDGYVLYVSRLEPENNAHLVVKAFEGAATPKRLVVVGDAPYSRSYIRSLRATTDTRILFPGAIYAEGYRQLQRHAFAYVQATEVGGTHPALLEAMACGGMVIANDTPENREVLGDAGVLYRRNDVEDLRRCLCNVLNQPEIRARYRARARNRVASCYSWDHVTDQYLELFAQLLGEAAVGAGERGIAAGEPTATAADPAITHPAVTHPAVSGGVAEGIR
ncbi:MAG: glycosyltransferase [Planctomycetota bacterium]